jgi:hypothetical protein
MLVSFGAAASLHGELGWWAGSVVARTTSMPRTEKEKPKQEQPKQEQRARSPKPGASDHDQSPDIIADEAERLKSSTSRDRNKRAHTQSTKRQKPN